MNPNSNSTNFKALSLYNSLTLSETASSVVVVVLLTSPIDTVSKMKPLLRYLAHFDSLVVGLLASSVFLEEALNSVTTVFNALAKAS